MDDALKAELLACALALANAARPETLRYFRSDTLETDDKGTQGFDPVTVADRNAEAAMRATLGHLRPNDAIFGEEFGESVGTTGLTWVLDPIDGTRGYIAGTPTWGVLIAVGDDSGPLLGIIDQPYIGERFVGGLGQRWRDGPGGFLGLRCRPPRPLSEAILFSTFPEVGTKDDLAAFRRVADRARLVRYGMDCYAYALVATGQVDLVIEAGLAAYDIQAPIAVIEAAGGIVTDWQGGPAHRGGRVIAAANAEIHAEAIALLQSGPA
ncbi:inositol monophosphatase family protein [Oceaniovalibus sp. ACAM 378]|uniref:inositol monophosphatase family protein n=1 Tax=Oceaniovalibus sp. ACAM 378 TaxID=2599923 RepID=UPI0011D8E8F6|nr:inositol monophosphatase family protein [Oceaniovalibus sp. ACAM 378]TYB87022.1 inositol monophosphatase family protein [Oceaniovalibus sp. ACAM 378]